MMLQKQFHIASKRNENSNLFYLNQINDCLGCLRCCKGLGTLSEIPITKADKEISHPTDLKMHCIMFVLLQKCQIHENAIMALVILFFFQQYFYVIADRGEFQNYMNLKYGYHMLFVYFFSLQKSYAAHEYIGQSTFQNRLVSSFI